MDNIAYRIFISFLSCFFVWVVWFIVASICRSKNQKWRATETCITFFLMMSFGVLLGLIFVAICGAVEYIRYLDNKEDSKESNAPKEKTDKVDLQKDEDKKNVENDSEVPKEEPNKETKASKEESDKVIIKKTKNKRSKKMKRSSKRIIIIAICSILTIAVIALTTTLILTINNYQETIEDLERDIEELEEAEGTESNEVKDPYSFDTVGELVVAIKKNPTMYNNKRVNVVGTMAKMGEDYSSVLIDDCGYDFSTYSPSSGFDVKLYSWLRKLKDANYLIDVIISDDIQNTVIETGDYVKMYGTVIISNGEIYLTNCNYDLIAIRSERQ